MITVGGKAALFELALALFEAGQEVVLPSPCWVSFPEQIRFAGAAPVDGAHLRSTTASASTPGRCSTR